MSVALVKPEKHCRDKSCQQENPQPISNFNRNAKQKDGLQYYCRVCTATRTKAHQKRFPDKWAGYSRKYRVSNYDKHRANAKAFQLKNPDSVKNTVLKRNFGITIEQYNSMFASQQGRCAICDTHSSEFKRSLAVDHCHETGRVRQLLCHHCNTALGLLDDSIARVASVLDYLERHS